jgi:hypothetical protein
MFFMWEVLVRHSSQIVSGAAMPVRTFVRCREPRER